MLCNIWRDPAEELIAIRMSVPDMEKVDTHLHGKSVQMYVQYVNFHGDSQYRHIMYLHIIRSHLCKLL